MTIVWNWLILYLNKIYFTKTIVLSSSCNTHRIACSSHFLSDCHRANFEAWIGQVSGSKAWLTPHRGAAPGTGRTRSVIAQKIAFESKKCPVRGQEGGAVCVVVFTITLCLQFTRVDALCIEERREEINLSIYLSNQSV